MKYGIKLVEQPSNKAGTGEVFHIHDAGQDWLATWHEPATVPDGQAHGSAAACLTSTGGIVLVSANGGLSWQFPGGRPERGEGWQATLEREVREEACARVDAATLVGFIRLSCHHGVREGEVLVRSLWRAEVTLLPWHPRHEMTHRRVAGLEEALASLTRPQGVGPMYAKWLRLALTAS
ncbi:MAG: NUDIX domain-containing protein [Gammaproteobacteria bacterium]|nr:NUDIX domain-containing protein [Gammaproteobacteria bacterium]